MASNPSQTSWISRQDIWVACAYVVVGMGLYIPALSCHFLSDDFVHITEIAEHGYFEMGGFLRPIVALSYVADYSLWGLDPFGFHLTNVLWHVGNSILLYYLVRALSVDLLMSNSRMFPFMTAMLFLALASHSEPVTWIAGRSDVMATAFGLLATILFLLSAKQPDAFRLSLFCVAFALSLLSKESAIALPAVWMVIAASYTFFLSRRASGFIAPISSGLVVLGAYFIARKLTLGQWVGGYGTEQHTELLTAQTLKNILVFALRSCCPGIPFRTILLMIGSGAGVGLSAVLFLGVSARRASLFFLFSACFLLSLIPVATLRVDLFDSQGERFLYLPSAFACAALISAVVLVLRNRHHQVLACLGLVLIHAVGLHTMNQRWVKASDMAQEIARLVSRQDPEQCLIVNVPDNYRGAYVFRNGLNAAATLAGNPGLHKYEVLIKHDVVSLSDSFAVELRDGQVLLTGPPHWKVRGGLPNNHRAVTTDQDVLLVGAQNRFRQQSALSYCLGEPFLMKLYDLTANEPALVHGE